MTTTWLAVTPLDTIMVRDGRPFDMGAASTARTVPPPPNTLGGVVRSALDPDRSVDHILGPVVDTARGVVFPAPRDMVRDGGTVRRLAVAERAATALSDLDDRRRLSHHLVGDGDPVTKWITRRGLTDWLTGAMPPGTIATPPLRADPAWVPESRVGLARSRSGARAGTVTPGLLYSTIQFRPREGTRFLVGCVDDEPVEIRDTLVPLGGRGRLAEVSGDVTGGVLPPAPEDFPRGRLAVYLATPALLTDRFWSPPQAQLSAVAVAGHQPVVSASPRGDFAGSRVLAWAVPAGSVFYLTFPTPEDAKRWSTTYHGELIPTQSALPIVTAGFGTCLTGRW